MTITKRLFTINPDSHHFGDWCNGSTTDSESVESTCKTNNLHGSCGAECGVVLQARRSGKTKSIQQAQPDVALVIHTFGLDPDHDTSFGMVRSRRSKRRVLDQITNNELHKACRGEAIAAYIAFNNQDAIDHSKSLMRMQELGVEMFRREAIDRDVPIEYDRHDPLTGA